MMRATTFRAVIGTLLLAAVLTACTTTKKTAEWRDDTYTGGAFDNILVIGVAKENSVRRMFESNVVSALKARNVTAIPSFSIMATDEKISRESVKAAIAGKKVDAVLVTHLVGVDEQEVYYPPTYTPTMGPGYGYYGYYSRVYDYVYEPGYYQKYKVVKIESNLYNVSTEKLVWSMQSETVDPNIEEQLVKDNIKIFMEGLARQGLI